MLMPQGILIQLVIWIHQIPNIWRQEITCVLALHLKDITIPQEAAVALPAIYVTSLYAVTVAANVWAETLSPVAEAYEKKS